MRRGSSCIICGALIGAIVLEPGLLVADELHTHLELPENTQPFVTNAPASSTTSTGMSVRIGDWLELLRVQSPDLFRGE